MERATGGMDKRSLQRLPMRTRRQTAAIAIVAGRRSLPLALTSDCFYQRWHPPRAGAHGFGVMV